MEKEGSFPEDLVSQAYSHIYEEIDLKNIKYSLEIELENTQKAHNAIHEFLYIAPILFPDQENKDISWHNKSAFLVYHWEAFLHAHRSHIEALSANYNVGFILLRSTLELIIKGAFWECLSHSEFRNNSKVLDGEKNGKRLKAKLIETISLDTVEEDKLDRISGAIFDKIADISECPQYRISIKQIINQLSQWNIFDPIPNPQEKIYNEIYRRLSSDVHVIPDKIDIGKRLIAQEEGLFEQGVLRETLREYSLELLEIMDIAIVIELNIMKDIIMQNTQSQ
jgi:hypothetical protein